MSFTRDPRDLNRIQEKRIAKCRSLEIVGATRAIRRHCVDCSGGNAAEADVCPVVDCKLWPYRLGRLPRTVAKSERRVLLDPAIVFKYAETFDSARKVRDLLLSGELLDEIVPIDVPEPEPFTAMVTDSHSDA